MTHRARDESKVNSERGWARDKNEISDKQEWGRDGQNKYFFTLIVYI